MTTIEISEACKQFNTMDARLADEKCIVITRHGKQAFALADIGYLESLTETLEILSDPDALSMLTAGQADVEAGRLHDHDEIEGLFG